MFCVIPANKMNFYTENELVLNIYCAKSQGSLTSLKSYNKWQFNSMKWTAKLREVQTLFPMQNSYASRIFGI